jgi:putative DNA primase/helicase
MREPPAKDWDWTDGATGEWTVLGDCPETNKTTASPVDADDETLQRLVALPPLEYERTREYEAEKLNCRVSVLDKLVDEKRPPTVSPSGELQGRKIDLPDVEPWLEAVNGAQVLEQVAETFSQYIALPKGAAHALALWCGHAHGFTAFGCTPRLNVTSPEKSCGKTTLRDVISTLVPRPLLTENLSVAVLFRVIEKYRPALLADECDRWIRDNDELRGLLNAGHRRGGQALRCEGENNEVRAFNVFAPAVLCGIGALPGTLHDRSIVVRLERAKPGELLARFDSRHVEFEMELRRKLARFAADNVAKLQVHDPKMPESAFNRLADNWRPLFAVAEIAGGDWPQQCAAAFSKLTSNADVDAQGIGTTLLADIGQVFENERVDKLPSATLCNSLAEIEGREWAEWGRARKPISTHQLAKLLRRFQVTPQAIRIGDETPRGYLLTDFKEAFERYLSPITPFPECNTATTQQR